MPDGLGYVLHETLDQPGRHQALGSLADRSAGHLVVTIRPGQRGLLWLVRDIETALGKREGSAGGARNANERLGLLQAWGAAEGVREIFVRRADLLGAGGWRTLAGLACLWDARLWLSIQGASLSRNQSEFAREWGLPKMKWEVFESQWDEQLTAGENSTSETNALSQPELPALPDEPFPSWRAACRDQLAAGQFEKVDAALRAEFAEACAWFGEHSFDELWSELRRLVEVASGHDELLLRIRAWQIAAFRNGQMLKADLDALLGAAAPVKEVALDGAMAMRLRHHTQPRYPAVTALWIAGARSLADVAAVTLGDVVESGTRVLVGAEWLQLPKDAAALMRAAVLVRLSHGATSGDTLFIEYRAGSEAAQPMTERAARVVLGVMAREHGLPLLTRFNRTQGEDDQLWARRHGFRLSPLATEMAAAA